MDHNRIFTAFALVFLLSLTTAESGEVTFIDACCHSPELSDERLQQLIANASSGRAGNLFNVASTLDLRGETSKALVWHRKAAAAPDAYARAFSEYAFAVKSGPDYIKYLRLAIALDDESAELHALDPASKFPFTAADARYWINLRRVESGVSGVFAFCETTRKSNRDDLIVGLIFRAEKSFSKWPDSVKQQYLDCRPGLVEALKEKRLLRSAIREAMLADPSNPNLVEPSWNSK